MEEGTRKAFDAVKTAISSSNIGKKCSIVTDRCVRARGYRRRVFVHRRAWKTQKARN